MTVLEHEDINLMSKEELNSYEKREKDRLNIKNYRVYWRKKFNNIPQGYVILAKIHEDYRCAGLLNSSVRFIDKLTEITYKFIIKDYYIYIDEKFTTEDTISRTKQLVGEIIGENTALDKWMI